jgi:hypothetical protein
MKPALAKELSRDVLLSVQAGQRDIITMATPHRFMASHNGQQKRMA